MRASIREVVITLLEAVVLVVLVVFIFLQNWRATMIPLLTVPVSIVGTFALFPLLGFTINMTSMFGLVLAIGMVVDDAIVVVEAVQHNLDIGDEPARSDYSRHGGRLRAGGRDRLHSGGGVHPGGVPRRHQRSDLPAVRADHRGLGADLGIQRAVAQPGAQRDDPAAEKRKPRRCSAASSGIQPGFRLDYEPLPVRRRDADPPLGAGVGGLAAVYIGAGWLFKTLPDGFLPDEDQGVFFAAMRLPDGASIHRDERAAEQIEKR